ncbi:MAG TPA: hypothetical protein VMT15_10945 [Bryobacteraceae bacterium]|nr:hypothetical protein [Bryobacteraceae bacterium]
MKPIVLASTLALLGLAQQPPIPPPPPGTPPDVLLPGGKSQREEILKAEHKKNLEDAAAISKLADEVAEELGKDDRYVVSVKTLKKLDEIERLTKAIRGRLKKY